MTESKGWLDRMKNSWPDTPDFPTETASEPEDNRAAGWDYKTVVLTGGFMGRHKEELDRRAFEKHLDQLGAEGFELAWVLLEQALQGEKDGHVMIFKRRRATGSA